MHNAKYELTKTRGSKMPFIPHFYSLLMNMFICQVNKIDIPFSVGIIHPRTLFCNQDMPKTFQFSIRASTLLSVG